MRASKSIKRSVALIVLTSVCAVRAMAAEDLVSYSGTDLFVRYCASCHGTRGEGDGPVAPFFKLQPPDLTKIARRHGGKFPTEDVGKIIDGRENLAAHGTRSMPVWGFEFALAQGGTREARDQAQTLISRLVEYLRSIQSD
jgi:mono/diheme cytochrome c family protein